MSGGKRQKGSLLVAVMVMLLLGLLLLNGVQRQLDEAIRRGVGEREALQAYNQAVSGLNWGKGLRWRSREQLFCQQIESEALLACLTPEDKRGVALLWGEGGGREGQRLRLYQQVRLDTASPGELERRLQMVPQSWLDYCPAHYQHWCEEGEHGQEEVG